MTSQVQSEANRRNALKSTGPKSKKGKGRASLNALKHGLRSKDIVLPSEDGREFDGLRLALITELEPEGSLEEQFAERIVVCLWRLRRVYPIEAGIFVWDTGAALVLLRRSVGVSGLSVALVSRHHYQE